MVPGCKFLLVRYSVNRVSMQAEKSRTHIVIVYKILLDMMKLNLATSFLYPNQISSSSKQVSGPYE